MSCLLEESLNTQKKLAKYAEKKGIKIAYNISPYLAEKGANNIKEILKRTEVFVLNRCEAEYLVKGKNIPQLLKNITKLGPKIAVITEGKKGAFAYDGTHYYQQKPNKIKIIETTGAGDAFASSFICGIIKKNDINFAMKLAQTNAESVIQHHGAKNKLLRFNEALKLVNKKRT
jgi:ribokinase